ncbi:MAG: hypothetical protein HRT58_05135 [Crocinitomicaceae bacterium]|nr:hypothetical protein [Flavobacteriales bacterium]NQZ35023.1 hypothetical protein [Crocinitomicaceae bacterium]
MTREARALFLSMLTLVVYAVSIFISQGSFIFPFPLNEFIFLGISAQFFWWNRLGNKWAGSIAIVAGICAVLSKQFFWTFLYSTEAMEFFMDSLITDYCLLAFYVLVLIGAIATMIRQKKGIALLFSAFFVLAFISGVFYNHALLLLLAYGFMSVSTQLSKAFAPYHLLWILLFILKLTEWLTFFLNS